MALGVAIVGAGPAGFYTAEALVKAGQDVRVDIFERLPAPFGLVAFGVAPDNQTTKNVTRVFERTALRPEVRYFGNIEIGRDIELAELRACYDAVVLSTGAPRDRRLGIPGEDKAGVLGSAAFVGWYNGHPDFADLDPDLDTGAVAVVGHGNVALDITRVLVKTPAEMAVTDLADHAARVVHASPLTEVHICGRRGPVEASFTNVELREMEHLADCLSLVDADQLPEDVGDLPERERRIRGKNLATLKTLAETKAAAQSKRAHFHFFAAPVEILGGERVTGLRLERTRLVDGRAVGTGDCFDLDCGLVVTAIGTVSPVVDGVPFDEQRGTVISENGRVGDGLYAAGWVKRGSTGVISTNRRDAAAVAEYVAADLEIGAKPGREAMERLIAERGLRPVTYAQWQQIDGAQIAAASPGAPRRKFASIAEMLAVLWPNGKRPMPTSG